MTRLSNFLVPSLSLMFALLGCEKSPAENTAKPVAPTDAAVTPDVKEPEGGAPGPAGAYPTPSGTPTATMSFEERFAHEKANRPTGTAKAEDVIEAIKKAGVETRDVQQHLGSPFGAAFCTGLKAGKDVHASVCEYKDAKSANEGRATSMQLPVPNREIYVNGATTLTVRVGTHSETEDAIAKRMMTAFNSVKPPAAPAK